MQLIESSTGPVWRKQNRADRERIRDACQALQSTNSGKEFRDSERDASPG